MYAQPTHLTWERFYYFINDIIAVMLDSAEVVKRHASSALLSIFVSIRPFAGDKEPVPRKEVVSESK